MKQTIDGAKGLLQKVLNAAVQKGCFLTTIDACNAQGALEFLVNLVTQPTKKDGLQDEPTGGSAARDPQ